MADTTLTWLGHASFRLDTASGKRIYVDPFLNGNPKCPENEKTPERVDIIALTHGHGDHVGDTVDLAKKHGATVVALVELAGWLGKQGVDESQAAESEQGRHRRRGRRQVHADERVPLRLRAGRLLRRRAVGLIVTTEDDKKVYFAGDTNVFGDMQLIGRIYEPDVAVLPIGDHFTMGPKEAAVAVELLGVKRIVPCHWGTFGLLTGTPDELEKLAPSGVTIEKIEPGDSVTV